MATAVGILGLGVYLPPQMRRNDWWPPEQVDRWMQERRAGGPPPEAHTEGARRVLDAILGRMADPFQGTVARHVMPDDMSLLDMEERAAREAITRAGIDLRDIDLLLTNMVVPEVLLGNPAASLHDRLGLQQACFSMHSDVVSYTFMMQLQLAEAMIKAGRARAALLVQSCAPSRLLDMTSAASPFFGDAATAVVVGPVAEGRGLEAFVHVTDGRYQKSLIISVPGARWYDEGRPILHVADPLQAQRLFLETADRWNECVEAVLAKASCTRADVDFVCIHQGAPWLHAAVQEHIGLRSARSIDTFSRTGHVFASSQPINLALAEEQGLLRAGDRVLLLGGGAGLVYGAALVRWGA